LIGHRLNVIMSHATTSPAPPPGLTRRWWRAIGRTEARLLVLVLGAMLAIWIFLGLTGEVRELETARFDRAVLLAFRRPDDLATPIGPLWLQESSRDITAFGGFTALTVIVVLGVILLLAHGRRIQALIFGVTVLIAQGAAEAIRLVVDRARPDIVPHHDLVYSASFPSGHAVMSPAVYLTLAAILAADERRESVRALLVVSAVVLVLAIGVSRVYLGVHWPTDVLAGWTLGTAIALVATFVLHLTTPRPAKFADAAADWEGVH
jgi:undecaprenyl-diphosphatase